MAVQPSEVQFACVQIKTKKQANEYTCYATYFQTDFVSHACFNFNRLLYIMATSWSREIHMYIWQTLVNSGRASVAGCGWPGHPGRCRCRLRPQGMVSEGRYWSVIRNCGDVLYYVSYKDCKWTVWHTSDSRWWTVSPESRNHAWTRCHRISWLDLLVLLLHVVWLCSLISKIQEIS